MRNALFVVVGVFALVLSSACENRSPIEPTSGGIVLEPVVGPNSELEWEFWRGDPDCIATSDFPCIPPAERLVPSGTESRARTGNFETTSSTDIKHDLSVRINYPEVVGHTLKMTIEEDVAQNWMVTHVYDDLPPTGNRQIGVSRGGIISQTRREAGNASIRIRVEERGNDLPQGMVLLEAYLRVQLK
jgi:hypothetical protein